MLKKLIIATAVLATSSSFALTGAPYVGVGVGVEDSTSKLSAEGNTVDKFGARNALVNVFAGYGALVYQRIYLGGEAFFNGTSATAKASFDDGSVKLTARNSYGLSFMPGVMLSERTMAYVRAGVVRGMYRVKATAEGQYAAQNNTQTGGQVGLGLQTSLSQHVDLRGEYVYTGYRSYSVSGSKVYPSSDQFNLAAVYKFN